MQLFWLMVIANEAPEPHYERPRAPGGDLVSCALVIELQNRLELEAVRRWADYLCSAFTQQPRHHFVKFPYQGSVYQQGMSGEMREQTA